MPALASVIPLYPSVVEESQSTYQKPDHKPTVRQLILSCKGIHPATKAVLAEVCSMCAGAERRRYDGGNARLAKQLGITEPMVSRHLRHLRESGLLEVSGGGKNNGKGKARLIIPNPELMDAYLSGNSESITEVVRKYYRSGNTSNTEVVRNNYRSGKHNVLECKEECKENEEQRSGSSAIDAANAAEKFLKDEIERLKERLFVWEDTARENGRLYAEEVTRRQEVEAGREADRAAARRVVASRDKTIEELKARLANMVVAPVKEQRPAPVRGPFVPPTFEEALAYMISQRPHNPAAEIERMAERYMGHYTGNGWKTGKNPVKDWKGCCHTFLSDVPKMQPPGQAVAPTSHLAVPQHPDSFRLELKPEYEAEQKRKEQERRDAQTQARIAKWREEEAAKDQTA